MVRTFVQFLPSSQKEKLEGHFLEKRPEREIHYFRKQRVVVLQHVLMAEMRQMTFTTKRWGIFC